MSEETKYNTPYVKALAAYIEDPTPEKGYAVETEVKNMIMFAITFVEKARIQILQSHVNPSMADGKHPAPALPIPGLDFISIEEYEKREKEKKDG